MQRLHSGNRLLDSLPEPTRQAVVARVRAVDLSSGDVLSRQGGDLPAAVHFPVTAMLSLVTQVSDGFSIEVSTIGHEGMSGAPLLLGVGALSNAECLCQVAGASLSASADDFVDLVERYPPLRTLCMGYIGVLLTQLGQTVACARLHKTPQRCARWLLMTQDRVGRRHFHLTHEFLGFMLGTRRETVSQALEALQRAGLIRSRHGDIEILDRGGLEGRACECYLVVNEAVDQLYTGHAA